jgi:hypothetical protein
MAATYEEVARQPTIREWEKTVTRVPSWSYEYHKTKEIDTTELPLDDQVRVLEGFIGDHHHSLDLSQRRLFMRYPNGVFRGNLEVVSEKFNHSSFPMR